MPATSSNSETRLLRFFCPEKTTVASPRAESQTQVKSNSAPSRVRFMVSSLVFDRLANGLCRDCRTRFLVVRSGRAESLQFGEQDRVRRRFVGAGAVSDSIHFRPDDRKALLRCYRNLPGQLSGSGATSSGCSTPDTLGRLSTRSCSPPRRPSTGGNWSQGWTTLCFLG